MAVDLLLEERKFDKNPSATAEEVADGTPRAWGTLRQLTAHLETARGTAGRRT